MNSTYYSERYVRLRLRRGIIMPPTIKHLKTITWWHRNDPTWHESGPTLIWEHNQATSNSSRNHINIYRWYLTTDTWYLMIQAIIFMTGILITNQRISSFKYFLSNLSCRPKFARQKKFEFRWKWKKSWSNLPHCLTVSCTAWANGQNTNIWHSVPEARYFLVVIQLTFR
jgi:hypothetical protein